MTTRSVTPSIYENLPPRDTEAEEALLASLIMNPSTFVEVQGFVEKEHFFREHNGQIFEAIMKLYQSGAEVNLVTVAYAISGIMEKIGTGYLAKCVAECPSVLAGRFYADIIRNCAISRHLLSELHAISRLIYQDKDPIELRDRAMTMLATVTTGTGGDSVSVGDVIRNGLRDEMDEWMKNPGKIRGITTGYNKLDTMIDGLLGGSVIAVVADSGIGKSQFCYNIALRIAKAGTPVSIISTEMPDVQLTRRLIFLEGRVNAVSVKKRNPKVLTSDEITRLTAATPRVEALPIYPSYAATLSAVESEVFRKKLVHGVRVVILDHIQHISVTGTDNDTVALQNIMKSLKDMAVKHDVAIIVVSHVNREAIKFGHVGLDFAKGSSSIKQDIDIGLVLECFEDGPNGLRTLRKDEINRQVMETGNVNVKIYGEKVRDGMGEIIKFNLSWDAGGEFREW